MRSFSLARFNHRRLRRSIDGKNPQFSVLAEARNFDRGFVAAVGDRRIWEFVFGW